MQAVAEQGAALGFRELGITGGEPMMIRDMPQRIVAAAEYIPVTVNTNGTVWNERRLAALAPLGGLPVVVQISLDSAKPIANDEMRGPGNFEKVLDAVPKLVEMGIHVKIATTLEDPEHTDLTDLCALHESLGIRDEDHVIRGIVNRGRALETGMGSSAGFSELFPELTITADGAFWSPFAPTVLGGRLDTDLLVSRTTDPLETAANLMLELIGDSDPASTFDQRFVCA
jgi:MoaA/NifB/PqqE/SkfB family radical SAM enzyme